MAGSLFRCLFHYLNQRLLRCYRSLSLGIRHSVAFVRSWLVKQESQPTPLSPHLQLIKSWAAKYQEMRPTPDDFPPLLTPEDGPLLVVYNTTNISYYYTSKVYIKRQAHQDELGLDIYGAPIVDPYITDRIRIEAANLRFIAAHTTIPVPKLLDVWQDPRNGLWHLKTELVHGAMELMEIDAAQRPAAVAKVEAQLEADILPQLRRLRRRFMGSADPALPVVPPHRCWKSKDTRIWSAMPLENDDDDDDDDDDETYVFCHTDLGRQNILVDPTTFAIVSIIDWETAGFFPASWELPLWRANDRVERHQMTQAARPLELAAIEAVEADSSATAVPDTIGS